MKKTPSLLERVGAMVDEITALAREARVLVTLRTAREQRDRPDLWGAHGTEIRFPRDPPFGRRCTCGAIAASPNPLLGVVHTPGCEMVRVEVSSGS